MNINLILPDMVLRYWPTISTILNKALEYGQGESTLVDYMQKILNLEAQCWVITEDDVIVGAGLTEFMNYKQHRTLHIIVFSGSDFESQSEMFPMVVKFAKDNGCKSVEQWGRKGWAKMLPKYIPEFKEVYTVMRYDLTNGENKNEI